MSAGRPLWRRGFDRAERAVGEPLEELVATRRFNDALVLAFRAQGAMYRLFERQTRAALHMWNMPARSDVAKLQRQVASLTAEVRELNAKLDQQQRRQQRAARRSSGSGAKR